MGIKLSSIVGAYTGLVIGLILSSILKYNGKGLVYLNSISSKLGVNPSNGALSDLFIYLLPAVFCIIIFSLVGALVGAMRES
jgi:hypothetical protein